MNQLTFTDTYRELERILNYFEIGWVAEQVAQTIREGKKIEYKESKGATIIRTEEYSDKEKLLLLIEAIERAVVQTNEIQNAVTKFFNQKESDVKIRSIKFYPEDEKSEFEDVFEFHLLSDQEQVMQQKNQANNELKIYLKDLRTEVTNSAD